MGCDSFNPHYDMTQGQYFGSSLEKKIYLEKKGKRQLSGSFSPKKSSKTQIICSREQAKALDQSGPKAERKRADMKGV